MTAVCAVDEMVQRGNPLNGRFQQGPRGRAGGPLVSQLWGEDDSDLILITFTV